jgi:hypothetical protein
LNAWSRLGTRAILPLVVVEVVVVVVVVVAAAAAEVAVAVAVRLPLTIMYTSFLPKFVFPLSSQIAKRFTQYLEPRFEFNYAICSSSQTGELGRQRRAIY